MKASVRVSFVAVLMMVGVSDARAICAPDTIDPTGTWTWVRELQGQMAQSVLRLSYKSGKLSGTFKRQGQVVSIVNARLDKNEVSFDAEGKWNEETVHGKFRGKVAADAIRGTIEVGNENGSIPLDWVAKRGVDFDDVLGTWKLRIVTPSGETLEPTLKLAFEEGCLKGTYTSRFGAREAKAIHIDGLAISWTVEVERNGHKFKGIYTGTLDGQAIKGSLDLKLDGKSAALEFTGRRAARAGAKAGEDKTNAENSKSGQKPAGDKSTGRSVSKRRVIAMLKNRRDVLLVFSSPRLGPAFSIRNDGQAVASEISLKELQARYPQMYELYRTAYVNVWAGGL